MLERNKMGDEKMKTATEMIKILKKEIVVLERKELLENFGYYKSKNYSEIKIQHYDYLKHLYKKRHIPLTLPPIEKISDYKICKIADYINYKCNK